MPPLSTSLPSRSFSTFLVAHSTLTLLRQTRKYNSQSPNKSPKIKNRIRRHSAYLPPPAHEPYLPLRVKLRQPGIYFRIPAKAVPCVIFTRKRKYGYDRFVGWIWASRGGWYFLFEWRNSKSGTIHLSIFFLAHERYLNYFMTGYICSPPFRISRNLSFRTCAICVSHAPNRSSKILQI
jgi:hypothetical protein